MINVYKNKLSFFVKNNKLLYFFIAFLLYFMFFDSFEITLPLYFGSKKIDIAILGTVLALSKMIRSIIVIPISRINNKYKLKFLMGFFVIDIAFLLLLIKTTNIVLIYIAFIVLLSTTSVFNVILNPFLASLVPKNKIGITFGVRDVFLYGGGFIGLLITGLISKYCGYTKLFQYYILLFILLVIIVTLMQKHIFNMFTDSEKETQEENSNIIDTKESIKEMNKDFLLFLIASSLFTIGMMSIPYVPLYGANIGVNESSIYYLFSSSIIISSVLAIAGGLIVDRYNKKKLFIFDGLISIIIFSLFVLDNKPLFIIGVLMTGLGTLFDNTTSAYLFNTFSEKYVDKYWGVVSSVSLISASAGVAFFGLIYKLNSTLVFPIAILVTSIAIIISVKLKDVEKEQTSESR